MSIALKEEKANIDLSLSMWALIKTTIGQVHLLGGLAVGKDNLSFLGFFITLILL